MIRRFVFLTCLVLAGPLAAADFSLLDRQGARQLLSAESHRQPTVIALWSSDCVYCRKNLKLLSELVRQHPQMRLITVAAEPESAQLIPLLASYGASGQRYAYGSDAPEAIAYAIDPKWGGELPRTFLFDGKGGKVTIAGVVSAGAVAKGTGLRF